MLSILLLSGLLAGLWLDVPFVHQQKSGCGSAVIWMIMKYWSTEGVPSSADIQRELYSAEAGGIYASEMERYFTEHAFQTFAFKAGWDDIEQHLTHRRPLIVSLGRDGGGVPLHYVVVAGFDAERGMVWLNDPADNKLVPMSRSEFEKQWMDNWTLLAVPDKVGGGEPRSDLQPSPIPVPGSSPDMEAATAAFREGRYSDARREVRSILRTHPSDPLVNDFMATLFFLDDNLEGAIKYWNRAGKPYVVDLRFDPPLRTNAVLVERAIGLSRFSTLDLDHYRSTRARLDQVSVFSRYRIDLEPADDGRFNAVFRADERRGFSILSAIRGLPFKTVQPELFNIAGRAINIESLFRWDRARRRAGISVEAPIVRRPQWKYGAGFDLRDERWEEGGEVTKVRKGELKMFLQAVHGPWLWTSGFAIARTDRHELKYTGRLERSLLDVPERRLTSIGSISLDVGRTFHAEPAKFAKTEVALETRWLPGAQGSDYETTLILRGGKSLGQPPFEEMFVVGMDRDHDGGLRAHRATHRNGFVSSSLDLQKKLYGGTFFDLSAGPFLDYGILSGEPRSAIDTGLQVRLSILGSVHFNVSYARDLRSSRSMVFTNTSH